MRTRVSAVPILSGIFLFIAPFMRSEEFCGEFVFPTLTGSVVTAEENSEVTFPVLINSSTQHCSEHARVTISISQCSNQYIEAGITACNIIFRNGVCIPVNIGMCECPGAMQEKGTTFLVNFTVERADNCTFSFEGGFRDRIKPAKLSFNVIYPPRMVNLTVKSEDVLTTEVVEENSTVEVTCTWDPGNPDVQAILTDTHGQIIGNVTTAGPFLGHRSSPDENHYKQHYAYYYRERRFTLERVRCQDAGHIHCLAPRSAENRTATLLVRCVPDITLAQLRVTLDGTVGLILAVRSHSWSFNECMLHEVQNLKAEYPCTILFVAGTPPDMTVHVLLENVTTSSQGTWRLTLANDAGAGHLDFTLNLTQTDSTESPVSAQTTPTTDKVVIIVVSTVIVGLSVATVTLTALCMKRGSRNKTTQASGPEKQTSERPRCLGIGKKRQMENIHHPFEEFADRQEMLCILPISQPHPTFFTDTDVDISFESSDVCGQHYGNKHAYYSHSSGEDIFDVSNAQSLKTTSLCSEPQQSDAWP